MSQSSEHNERAIISTDDGHDGRNGLFRYDDALSRLGDAADSYVRSNVFDDYQRKKSLGTQLAQHDDLAVFSRFLASAGIERSADALFTDPHAWAGMKASTIELFRRWLYYGQSADNSTGKRKGYAISSVRRYLSTIRQYCKLAYQSGVIPSDEWIRITAVKADSHSEGANIDVAREKQGIHPRMSTKKTYATELDTQDIFELRHATTDAPRYREHDIVLTERDTLLMCLLGEHGLRVGEVVALDATSINVRKGTMVVKRPKSHTQDTLKVKPATLRAAAQYLPLIPADGPLFYGYEEKRMTRQGIYKRVHELGELAGIPKLSPHDLRHFFAKDAFLQGNPLSVIQKYGGWTSGHMPLRYAQVYGTEVADLQVSTETGASDND